MITGTGTGPILPWPHQVKDGSKPEIGPPAANSSAAPRKADMPPSVTTKGGTLSRVIAMPCSQPHSDPDRDRRERRGDPAVADAALSDGEAVLEPALGDGRRDQPGEGDQRADRQVDAGGQDHEGHADRKQPGDRHLPHDVEEVDRGEEPRLDDGEQRHQHDQEDRRRETRDEAEDVEALVLGRFRRSRFGHRFPSFKPRQRRRPRLMRRHHRHQNFLRRVVAGDLAGDAALAHRDDPVRDRENFRQFGRDDDDGDAGLRHLDQEIVDLDLGADVDAARRLVDDQDFRPQREPARQHDLLLIAAGEVADRLVGARHADRAAACEIRRPARSRAARR